MMNSVARLTGQPAGQLNAGNCANPTFHGSLGAGASSPPDPFEALGGVQKLTNSGAGNTSKTAQPGAAGNASASAGPGSSSAADASLANGGSTDWRDAEPAAYERDGFTGFGVWAALVLFGAIVTPLLVRALVRRIRRS